MVNNKVNDMFEQQQNTGKSTSLAEKYANAVGQLSDANDRAAHAEHNLQVERITRQDLIDEEVARRVAEAEERIRKELEAQLADKTKELEERNKALDKRESDVDKKAETIAQNISEQVRQQMSAAKNRFEKTAQNRLADMFDMFMQAFIALGDKDSSKGQELLQKYQLAAKEAHESLTDEIKDKLAKVEAKSKSKTEQIASLVRMIFTQKRERVVFSKEERDTIYDKVLASVEFTDEEEKRYQECREFCEEYRKRKAIKKLLNSQKEQKGHGRNPIPEDMPRLEEKVLWPEGYIGHENEYVIVYHGKVQEFIVPAKVRYFVQPYRRPVVRRKDDPMQKLLQSPCYEDVFWKSYASAELLAQLECNKYVLHQPFNRQIKKMKTRLFYQNINLIEEMIKEKKLEGEEKAQFRKDYAESLWEDFKLLAASAILDVPKDSNIYQALNYMLRNYTELTNYIDIPDMPLDNNDTERLIRDMVMGKKAYLFCRDLDACKRAAMMYSLFGACKVLDKNPERWLCYVLKHIDSTPEDKYYTLLPEFWEDVEQ